MSTKADVTGGFAVPENAPKETSQPLSQELIQQQLAAARANEKVLPPFNPKPLGPPKGLVAKATRVVEEFFGSAADVVQTPPEAPVAAAGSVASLATPSEDQPPLPPPEPWQKAASDTDTPSRGIPTAIADPGKAITGGFGGLGPAQYFPLDGSELGAVILG